MKRFDPAFLLFLFLSLWSFGAHSQTTIDFNAVGDEGGFGTTFGDVDPADANEIAMAGGFLFTIDGPGVSSSYVQIIGVQNDGYNGTNAMRIQSFNGGDVTKWTIKKSNSEAFQFRGIHLRQREGHGSTSGTITGYKDGVATGSALVNFTITYNQLHDFSANSAFFDVDEIVIEAADLYVILDHFTHGSPVSVADQDPAEVLGISLVGNPVSTATNVAYTVTFSKPAYNVDISDFVLTTMESATATLGTLTGVSGSDRYTVTVNNIAGEGGLRLDLKAGTNIQNADGTGGTAAFTGGQVHSVGSCFTETFDQGETNGATSFSGNGKTFSLLGNWAVNTDIPHNGLGGSAYNLKNNGGGPYTIVSNDGVITVSQVYLYVSSVADGDNPTNDGSVTIRGLRDGNQIYTFTKSSGFAIDRDTDESGTHISGYTRIKFSDHSAAGEVIDQLEISIGGSFTYLNLDNFSWCLDFVPPSGYSVSINQSPIRPFNANAVSFSFANAEVGATYEYSISSTGGGGTVTGSGTILSQNQQVTGIDLSGLGNGTVTLSAKLADLSGNQGPTVTATAEKTDAGAPFITRWRTTSANETITIRTKSGVGGYNYTVNWGDGTTTSGHTGNASHTYAVADTYTVTISDEFPALFMPGAQLISVEQWGSRAWASMEQAFMGASNLKINASDVPNLSAVTSMEQMFANANNFNANLAGWDVSSVQNMRGMFQDAMAFNGDLSSWDVSSVQDMQGMFQNARAFNGDLSGWKPTSVTNMRDMFRDARAFNQSLSNWDVSTVQDMQGMFQNARAFNGDLSGWKPTSVTNMRDMFRDARAFNQSLSNWDVSAVQDMQGMFQDASAFNGDLSGWEPTNVTNMRDMFRDAGAFNQSLSSWDVSAVENMQGMFQNADAFNGDLSGWIPSSVTNMVDMFRDARAFNQNLSSWDVSAVENMQGMFQNADAFNGDLSGWTPSSVTNMVDMFRDATAFDQSLASWNIASIQNMANMLDGSGLSVFSYDATLIAWAAQETRPSDIVLGADGLLYCAGTEARQQLVADGWDITGDMRACDNSVPTDITLSNNTISHGDGQNAVVGTLATVDDDDDDTHTYSLVAGEGSDNNADFNISGNTLRANDASAMSLGTYSVLIRTTDSDEGFYEKIFSIQVINYPPIVTTSGGTTAFAEVLGDTPSPVTVDNGITVADLDNTTLASATVHITDNFQTDEDLLAFTNDGSTMADIEGSYDEATGILTLTVLGGGTATLDEWEAALRAVLYSNTSKTPNTDSRTITFVVNDGTANSAPATKAVSVADLNDPPTITAPDTIQVADYLFMPLLGFTFTDPDVGSALVDLTFSIPEGRGELRVTSGPVATITNQGSHSYTITGYMHSLRSYILAGSVSYRNAQGDPTPVILTVTLNDRGNTGNGGPQSASTTVVLTVTNVAPVVTTSGGTTVFTEVLGGTPNFTVIDDGITVSDEDNTTLVSATVRITGNYQDGEDLLAFANDDSTMGNIQGSYATGVLSLSSAGASATVDQWQAALRAVTYSNSSQNPTTNPRIITFVVNDGSEDSAPSTKEIEVVAVNNPPTISGVPQTSIDPGSAYDFTPVAADVDSETLIFSIVNPPVWAQFDPVTGQLSGTPDRGDVGVTAGIIIRVSDGESTASLPAFDLAVNPIAITGVTFEDGRFVYDGTEHVLAIRVADGSLPSGASVSYTSNGRTNVGAQTVTAVVAGTGYIPVQLTAELEVTPAVISGVTLSDRSFVYDGTEHALAISGTLPFGASVSYTNNGRSDVGTQTVTATISGSNYQTLELTAELEVTPAKISGVTLSDRSFVYDGTDHALAISGTLPSGANVTYTNNGRRDVGVQTVTATISGSNYQTLELTAELEVTPAVRSILFPALPEKTYGDSAFVLHASSSSGEPVTYTSSNEQVAKVVNGRVEILGAGTAFITATVPDNSNYSSKPVVQQELIVKKASQIITINLPTEVSRDAGTLPITAHSSSGLPLSFSIDDDQVAVIEGAGLTILRLGSVRITATQAGDANFLPAVPVTHSLRVGDPTAELPIRVHPALSPNGDGINDFLMIEGIRDFPVNRVTIFNRNGTVLFEASGYDNERIAFRGVSAGQMRLPAGTYFYIVEVNDRGTRKQHKGYFVLRY